MSHALVIQHLDLEFSPSSSALSSIVYVPNQAHAASREYSSLVRRTVRRRRGRRAVAVRHFVSR